MRHSRQHRFVPVAPGVGQRTELAIGPTDHAAYKLCYYPTPVSSRFFFSLVACLVLTPPVPQSLAADVPTSFPAAADLPAVSGLPDPLRRPDGSPITDTKQWPAQRAWMKAILEHYALGHAPPPPGYVRGEIFREAGVLDGKGTYRLVKLTFGPGESLHLQVALFLPGDGRGVYPTIIQPSFGATPGADPAPPKPVSLEAGALHAAPILARGYALLTYDYQQAGLDRADNRASGFFPAYPEADWSTETAWAWGLSRAVDYLETQPVVDKARIIAVGHSRLGKMTLIAGAYDERIALSVPAGSGTGGTAAYRLTGPGHGGESLQHIVEAFPHWFSPRLKEFVGQVDRLPFDQHWLIALTAPRALLTEDGVDDQGVNAPAVEASYRAAKSVYEWLGVGNRLGIYFRPGGHHLQAEDWAIILDFADRELRGMTVGRKFDVAPATP